MLRFLQVTENKPEKILHASEVMKRGAVVVEDYATETVANATDTTDFYFVDIDPKYEGINAVINPTEDTWENIEANAEVLKVVPLLGERYATTEIDTTLDKGTPVKPSAGKFVEAETGDAYKAVFMGVYNDPTFATGEVGIVQIVEPTTVTE